MHAWTTARHTFLIGAMIPKGRRRSSRNFSFCLCRFFFSYLYKYALLYFFSLFLLFLYNRILYLTFFFLLSNSSKKYKQFFIIFYNTMPTPSTLVSRNVVLDTLLTFLERIIDEKFWEGLIGQRLVELGKRYFGNDFVVLSLVYYIACKCDFLILSLIYIHGSIYICLTTTEWRKSCQNI